MVIVDVALFISENIFENLWTGIYQKYRSGSYDRKYLEWVETDEFGISHENQLQKKN